MREILLAAFFIVQNGAPKAVVVTPDKPSAPCRHAVAEIVGHVRLMSGAELPVKTESQLTDAEREGTLICAGRTDMAREAGIDAAKLSPESYVVKTVGRRLFLLGHEEEPPRKDDELHGTYDAAISFLEEDLGVRWLWPDFFPGTG
jgi:hypothetical protein